MVGYHQIYRLSWRHKERQMAKTIRRRPSIESDTVFEGIKENRPNTDLLGYTAFIYGPPKVGKTTVACSWPKPLVLACEPRGIRAMHVEHIPIRSWSNFEKAIKLLTKTATRKKYKSIIIDTADLMYKYCLSHCCNTFGFDHPSDQGWGKGWEAVSDMYMSAVLKLFDLNYTLIFISHSKTIEIKVDWEEYTRIDPTLANPARKVLLPYIDLIFYMWARESKKGNLIRTLTTKSTREYEAGDRTHFLTDVEVKIPSKKKDKAFSLLNKLFLENVKNNT